MKVLVYGYGLMGKKVAHAVMNDADLELAGVVSPVFDVQPEVPAYKSLDEVQDDIDAIIDFSHPSNLDKVLVYALKTKTPVLIATTGLTETDYKKINEASKEIAVLTPTNTSLGVNLLNELMKYIVPVLEETFDIEDLIEFYKKRGKKEAILLAKDNVEIFKDILEKRYSNNAKTMVSMNYSGNSVEDTLDAISIKYGERVYDRIFEMFNIIDLHGKSLRK